MRGRVPAAAAAVCCALRGAAGQVCPIDDDTTVVYYAGIGAAANCQRWERNFFDWWAAAEPRVKVQRLTAVNVKRGCTLTDYPNLRLYVQPGGNAYDQQRGIEASGKQNIKDFISSRGGAYLGTCAGWFYTASGYWWQGAKYDWADLLGLQPTLEGSITSIRDYDASPGYTLTGINGGGGRSLYWGGPTQGWNSTSGATKGQTLLRFSDVGGDLPAAVLDGNMLLTSVHLEAYEGNPSGLPAGVPPLTEQERVANYRMRAEWINRATGAGWAIP